MHLFRVLQNHNVAIDNVRADHRIAADAQGKCAPILLHIGGTRIERHVAFDSLLSQRRHPRWNLAIDWNVGNPNLHGRSDQSSGLPGMPIKKTLSFQRRNVLHYRRLTGESEMILDFTCAWRDPFLALLALDEIENSPLPFGQHSHIIAELPAKASSNEQIGLLESHLIGQQREINIPRQWSFRAHARNLTQADKSRRLTSVFEAPIVRSLALLGMTQNELQPHEIDEKLAPEIEHPAPGIFYVACCRLFENAFMNVVRNLVA